ncbi:hypothetical protein RQP46_001741 [Phenoliferia psychrophenolica]
MVTREFGASGPPVLPTSVRGLGGQPRRPSPSRPLSTSSVLGGSSRRRRRQLLLALLALFGLFLVLQSHRASTPSRADLRALARQLLSPDDRADCDLFPWRPECSGGEPDPFAGIKYEEEGGHLFYDPATGGPHPIHLLMSDAKRAWKHKVGRQSTNLAQAVAEYERRYGRRPPKLFPAWFQFAQTNSVVLVDEFDALHARIEPYYALPASLLRARSARLQSDEGLWMHKDTFTVEVRHSRGHPVLRTTGPMSQGVNERPEQMVELLTGIVKYLPEMNITFTGHDNPFIALSGEIREKMVAAAAAGEYLDESLRESNLDNHRKDGWAMMCPPQSPMRSAAPFVERRDVWVEPRPSFITNHVASMDLCSHPDRQMMHGFTAWDGPRPGVLFPLFSFSSTSMHSDFLVPPIDQYDIPIGDDPRWENKPLSQVVWRGSTTGANLDLPNMRKWSQRPRLCSLSRTSGTITLPMATQDTDTSISSTELVTTFASALGSAYFDAKFYGQPEQCHDRFACEEFRKRFTWADWMYQEDQNLFKFAIDVDGNGWSGRFYRLIASRMMVLKSTVFPEWYADQIQPWLHYVPVSTDYSDLWVIQAFFRGDRHGAGAHDRLAESIANEGKEWAETSWRLVDMQVYMYRLLIEYDRIMNRDDRVQTNMDM